MPEVDWFQSDVYFSIIRLTLLISAEIFSILSFFLLSSGPTSEIAQCPRCIRKKISLYSGALAIYLSFAHVYCTFGFSSLQKNFSDFLFFSSNAIVVYLFSCVFCYWILLARSLTFYIDTHLLSSFPCILVRKARVTCCITR